MLTQAIDYRDECDALYALLADVDAAHFSQPTQFKRWTLDDVLGHLHIADYTRVWLRGCGGPELLQRWHEFSRQVADEYAGLDPAQRVKWAGPEMSVR